MATDPNVAALDYTAFSAMYPEFDTIPMQVVQAYFSLAGLYLNNSGCSVVSDVAVRTVLLYLVTAHLLATFVGVNGQAPSGIVGRVSSATEGTVSVEADVGDLAPSAAFWASTSYGYAFWAATASYRGARYIPGPRRYLGVGRGMPGTQYFTGGWGGNTRWPQ